MPDVASLLDATNIFIVCLRMQGRQIFGPRSVSQVANRSVFWSSSFTTSSQVLPTDSGIYYIRDESEASSLPEVGSDVTIVADYDQFIKTINSVDGKVVTMKIFRKKAIEIITLNNRRGMFHF